MPWTEAGGQVPSWRTTVPLHSQKRALPNTPAKNLTHCHQAKKEFRAITTFLHRTGRKGEKRNHFNSSNISSKLGQHSNPQTVLVKYCSPKGNWDSNACNYTAIHTATSDRNEAGKSGKLKQKRQASNLSLSLPSLLFCFGSDISNLKQLYLCITPYIRSTHANSIPAWLAR